MAQARGSKFNDNPYGDTLEVLRERSNKNITLLERESGDRDDIYIDDPADKGKSAHLRRREQVRRAQRNHRGRKERYIKSLEQELTRLRDEREFLSNGIRSTTHENELLRYIMVSYGITPPGEEVPYKDQQHHSRLAKFTVLGKPLFGQRLQVSFDDERDQIPHVYPPGFGVPRNNLVAEKGCTAKTCSKNHSSADWSAVDEPSQPSQPAGQQDNPAPWTLKWSHPYGFDATQVGVDFVLFLERCCLHHLLPEEHEYAGHAVTIQAPLVAGLPDVLEDGMSWEIPASQVDRLFELAGALNLEGEITPIQAWTRIKHHPQFYKLDPPTLRQLSQNLVNQIKCFGFGAVLDEQVFTNIMERTYAAL